MARRRTRTINTQTWEPALTNINRMERAMVKLMAKLDGVTIDDVLDWMVPAEQLALLKAATPHCELNNSSFSGDQMRSLKFPFGAMTFYLDFVHMGVAPPKKSLINTQPGTPKATVLWAAMEKITSIVNDHNKLRTILATFTEKQVTQGAAKHYFPTLQSLLPSDHMFHTVKGDRFKDAQFNYGITELLREAPEIVARGLLCNPIANSAEPQGRSLVRVRAGDTGQVFTLFAKPV